MPQHSNQIFGAHPNAVQCKLLWESGARSGIRTRTILRSEDFKSSASTVPPSGHKSDKRLKDGILLKKRQV